MKLTEEHQVAILERWDLSERLRLLKEQKYVNHVAKNAIRLWQAGRNWAEMYGVTFLARCSGPLCSAPTSRRPPPPGTLAPARHVRERRRSEHLHRRHCSLARYLCVFLCSEMQSRCAPWNAHRPLTFITGITFPVDGFICAFTFRNGKELVQFQDDMGDDTDT